MNSSNRHIYLQIAIASIAILFNLTQMAQSISPKIQATNRNCSIQNSTYNINLDLRNLIELPDGIIRVGGIKIDDKEKLIMISFCRGISPSILKCDGKGNSGTSVCMVDAVNGTWPQSISDGNSDGIGFFARSNITIEGSQMTFEYPSYKNCTTEEKLIKTKVRLYCHPKRSDKPIYRGFNNCIHELEWGLPRLCDTLPIKSIMTKSMIGSSSNSTATVTPKDPQKNVNADQIPSKSEARHNQTLNEATSLLLGTTNQDPNETTSPNPNTIRPNSTATSTTVTPPSSSSTLPVIKNSTATTTSTTTTTTSSTTTSTTTTTTTTTTPPPTPISNAPLPASSATKVDASKGVPQPKTSGTQRFFTMTLLLLGVAGVCAAVFVMDKRGIFTDLRRRTRQVLQPSPVPYSRVNDFNHLDI